MRSRFFSALKFITLSLEREYNVKFLQKNWLLTAAVVVLILGGGIAWASQHKNSSTPATTQSETKKVVATVEVTDGTKTTHYDMTDGVGKTALDLTQEATGGKVVTKGTGENAFVLAINGRTASDTKKEYWEIDVNGAQLQVGSGSYTVKEGDKILWKIATY